MQSSAIYDAVNSIQRRGTPYLVEARTTGVPSPEAAVAATAHDVLFALVPAQRATIDSAYEAAVNAVSNPVEREAGIRVGRIAAVAILARREADGSATPAPWVAGAYPGQYRPTAPGNLAAA